MTTSVEVRLLPAERMALTVALAQVTEGRELLPNVGAVCVLALARISGLYDYTANPTDETDVDVSQVGP